MARASFHHGDLENAVLEATAAALESQDADQLSVRAIARDVGVSSSAVYRHYADRDALLRAVAAATYHRFAEALTAAADSIAGATAGAARARMVALSQAYVAFAHAHPAPFRLMFTPLARAPSGPESYAVLERCVADLTRTGAIRDDPRAAPLIWSAVHGLAALTLEGAVGKGPGRAGYAERVIGCGRRRPRAAISAQTPMKPAATTTPPATASIT